LVDQHTPLGVILEVADAPRDDGEVLQVVHGNDRQGGTLSAYEPPTCTPTDYGPGSPNGSTFIDGGHDLHMVRNNSTTVTADVYVVSIIPAGIDRRIDESNPTSSSARTDAQAHRPPSRGRCLTLTVGLAAAVHPRPLRQPPGPRVPRRSGRLPGPDEVVAYLSDYARDFELPVELSSRVRSVRQSEGGYLVELDKRTYEAGQVVIATNSARR
jgi:Pyridine nucleotide-disulphide oxidoreductase